MCTYGPRIFITCFMHWICRRQLLLGGRVVRF